jgi:hypothetical protein
LIISGIWGGYGSGSEIIPKVHLSQVTGTFTTALNALESDTTEALESTLRSFRNLHREVMKEAVWSILEQTKNTLKMLQKSEPELFARKIKVWNRASWLFTNFSIKQSRTVGGNYRKALNLLAGL